MFFGFRDQVDIILVLPELINTFVGFSGIHYTKIEYVAFHIFKLLFK